MCPDNSYFSCYDRLNKYSNMLTMNTHTWRTSSIILRFLMVIMIFVVVFIELDFAWGFQNYIIFGIWNLTIKEDEKPKIKIQLELSWAQLNFSRYIYHPSCAKDLSWILNTDIRSHTYMRIGIDDFRSWSYKTMGKPFVDNTSSK